MTTKVKAMHHLIKYFALLCFIIIIFFTNGGFVSALHQVYSAIFPVVFAYFVFLCNILIIISVFQTFPLLLYLLCDL